MYYIFKKWILFYKHIQKEMIGICEIKKRSKEILK